MKTRSALTAAVTSFVLVLALGAGPAWAGNEYEAPNSPGAFGGGGAGLQTFKLGSLTVTCEIAEFAGSQPVRAPTVEEEVKSYRECKMLSKKTTTANVFECSYLLGQPVGSGPYTAAMAINNHKVKCEITFAVSGVCTVIIKAQSSKQLIKLANFAPAAMKVNFGLEGLDYSHSGTGCTGIGSGEDGVYEGAENIENLIVI